MWQYNQWLIHSFSTEEAGHKYIAKVKVHDKYRYFYNQEDYNRYLNPPKKKFEISKFFNKIKKEIYKTQIDEILTNSGKQIEKGIAYISKVANKTIKEIKEHTNDNSEDIPPVLKENHQKKTEHKYVQKTEHKYVQKIKLSNGKYRYFYDEDSYNRYQDKLEYQNEEPLFMKDIPETRDLIDDTNAKITNIEEMNAVNENYDLGIEYQMNCMDCTTAYELRCRGYDVEAIANSGGETMGRFKEWFVNPDIHKITNTNPKRYNYANEIVNEIIQNSGKSSRGDLLVRWNQGGGHSLAYEIDDSGKFTILDTQVNKTIDIKLLSKYINEVTYVRTDNLQLKPGIKEAYNVKR